MAVDNEHFITSINELKNEYGVEINPVKNEKNMQVSMMGDLGDGKGFREIPT